MENCVMLNILQEMMNRNGQYDGRWLFGLVAKEDWRPVISRFTLKQFQTLILALGLKENAGDLNPRFLQQRFKDFAHAYAVKSVGLIPKLQTLF